ncbi:hypothetical protein D3C81_879750 [compost metagenome]
MLRGVIQGDEGGDGAETDGAQGQAATVGQHAAEHMHERQAFTDNNWRGGFRPGQQQANYSQQHDTHAHAPQAHLIDQQHPQRCADRQCAVTGNAVPRNDFGGVRRADAADAPANRAGTHQAFRAAEYQAADQQADQAEHRQALRPSRNQHEYATQARPGEAVHDRQFAAFVIDDFPGIRATEQGGQVLHADHQTCDYRAETQVAVDVTRQYGQGNADVQVADEGKKHDGNNLQRDRQGALVFRHG